MNTKTLPISPDASAEFKAMMAEFATLRGEVAVLAGRMKSTAVHAAENAAGQISGEATRLMGSVSDAGKSSVNAVERQVEAHPLASLMVAFSLGFIGSRLLAK
jgi:ElaB/YqjD/DUF883 family membrane-anchored ribosome-binding protein